jgi:hydrogenase-4 component F
MTLALLIAVPALLAIAALPLPPRAARSVLVGGATLHLGGVVALWIGLPGRGVAGAPLRLDAPGHLFLTIVSGLFLLTAVREWQGAPRWLALLSALSLACAGQDLALVWIAVAAATLAAAAAPPAGAPCRVLAAVGITAALLGTLFLGVAASARSAEVSLSLPALLDAAPGMPGAWVRTGFALALLGQGIQIGSAPAPLSAILANGALVGVLRSFQVCLAAGQAGFARGLLVAFGFAWLGIAIARMERERLLACAGMANLGAISVGVGLGGSATFAALLHAVNHAVAWTALFLADDRRPATGRLRTVAVLAAAGAAPFAPFMSQLMIFQSAVRAGHVALGLLLALLLALAFLTLARAALPTLPGSGATTTATATADRPPAPPTTGWVAPLLACAAALALGVYLPPALSRLLASAAGLLGGRR